MNSFKPFENDSQVVTLATGDDEFTIENGMEAVTLSGTLVVSKGDPASARKLRSLHAHIAGVLAALS